MARLEPEQETLLSVLCEAARTDRSPFMVLGFFGGALIKHPALPDDSRASVELTDLGVLGRYGLIDLQQTAKSSWRVVVLPEGFAHWEALEREKGGPMERIESTVRRLFDARPSAGPYAPAFDKWAEAEAQLWSAEAASRQLTTIGHLCREAMQLFAVAFVESLGVPVNKPVSHDVARIKAGLAALKGRLPEALVDMLDALLVYWGTVSDLVQRQEHGGLKEGEPLSWEDARVVVMQTAVVMLEFVRAAHRTGS